MTLTDKPTILSSEDRNRMARLYEEVRTRLEEMALIAARTLKLNAGPNSAVHFCPLGAPDARLEAIELIRTPQGRGGYDYRQGACFEYEEPARMPLHN